MHSRRLGRRFEDLASLFVSAFEGVHEFSAATDCFGPQRIVGCSRLVPARRDTKVSGCGIIRGKNDQPANYYVGKRSHNREMREHRHCVGLEEANFGGAVKSVILK